MMTLFGENRSPLVRRVATGMTLALALFVVATEGCRRGHERGRGPEGIYVFPGATPAAPQGGSSKPGRQTWDYTTDRSFEEVVSWYEHRYKRRGHSLRGPDLGAIAPEVPGAAGREQRVYFLSVPDPAGHAVVNVMILNPDVDRARHTIREITRISIIRQRTDGPS
jgi:hypothetical protein